MKILCIGDNNVDYYPQTQEVLPGGNCVNVAAYAALNGAEAVYLGNLGKDCWGEIQRQGMEKAGIKVIARWHDEKTSCATVQLVSHDRTFADYDNEIHRKHPIRLEVEEWEALKEYDVIHSTIYSIFAEGEPERIRSAGVPLTFDFSNDWEEDSFYEICPLVECAFFSCDGKTEDEILALLKESVRIGCKIAIGTKGKDGAFAYDGVRYYRQEAFRVTPVDTLGAGDSFISRFLQTYFDLSNGNKKFLNDLMAWGQQVEEQKIKEKVIEVSLSQAALFSARNCMMRGAFSSLI